MGDAFCCEITISVISGSILRVKITDFCIVSFIDGEAHYINLWLELSVSSKSHSKRLTRKPIIAIGEFFLLYGHLLPFYLVMISRLFRGFV